MDGLSFQGEASVLHTVWVCFQCLVDPVTFVLQVRLQQISLQTIRGISGKEASLPLCVGKVWQSLYLGTLR